MICTTEKMIAGGFCLSHTDSGKAVFIPFTLPNERVEIEIVSEHRDYLVARAVQICATSPHRITPQCPYFGRCGGCSLQMADADYQRELRLAILQDILLRAHVTPERPIQVVAGPDWGYRSRFQFHCTEDGKIGLKKESENTVIPITDCPVAVPEIRNALQHDMFAECLSGNSEKDRLHVFAYNNTVWHESEKIVCSIEILSKCIKFDVRGFFQSNMTMLAKLIPAVYDGISPGERLLDFYAGVGTFSLFANSYFKKVVLVEHNRNALTMAKQNITASVMSKTGLQSSFFDIRDEKWPKSDGAKLSYDVAIIDPPRQGIHSKTLQWFVSSDIPCIRYVSCDPVTFARDASKLVSGGYRLQKIILFDFYPQTHHIETLGYFTK